MKREGTKILVVDDELDMTENLEIILRRGGHEVLVETDSTKAESVIDQEQPDLLITDLRMPEIDGLSLLQRVKTAQPDIPVIVLTGYASVDSAVEAMKNGATDYLSKPFSPDELLLRIDKALAWTELTQENRYLRERVNSGEKNTVIMGQSPALMEVLETVKKVSGTNARVLLVGESGTGKELIARCIHRHSLRQQAPFFAINCGAFSESLLESELFGYERGAFTGAVKLKKGVFDVAYGGTLFLDEICETTTAFQTRLLRVVQEGEFLRVGGTRTLKTDVRIISSTNQDPRRCVSQGTLREDLYYRLSIVQIRLPPLRERAEDIPILAGYFADVYAQQIKKRIQGIRPDAGQMLARYGWPGNVRELQNVIERAVIMAENGGEIRTEDLPVELLECPTDDPEPMQEVRDAERDLLVRTLEECDWNRSLTAKKLRIGRRTLYDKMARLGISPRTFSPSRPTTGSSR